MGHGKHDEKGDKIKMELEAGDKVLFGKYAGTEIKLDGEEYVIMRQDDVQNVKNQQALAHPIFGGQFWPPRKFCFDTHMRARS